MLNGLIIGKPGNHNKANRNQHAHIVDQQPGGFPVNLGEQDQHRCQIYCLRSVKKQYRQFSHFQIQNGKCHKMQKKHQDILPQEEEIPILVRTFSENGKALEGIQCHQDNNQIFGNLYN